MMVDCLNSVRALGDAELILELHRMARCERLAMARLLVHMGEVDARGLFREFAFGSMFEYSVRELGMSEAEAYVRIRAARVGREFPVVLEMLARGELHLTGIKMLAPLLTAENHSALLERARRKSKREIEVLVAELAPQADSPTVVRAISPGRFKIEFTASQALREKIEVLKDLIRHQVPDGDLATVLERAVDVAIAQQRKVRFGATAKPKPRAAQGRERGENSRHVPAPVRREVIARDGERCSFVSREGRRCEARGWLEFHHQEAFAFGGEASVGNVAVVCSAHNRLFAERDFGRGFVDSFRSELGAAG